MIYTHISCISQSNTYKHRIYVNTLQISVDTTVVKLSSPLTTPAGGHHHVPCQQFAESHVTDQWEVHCFKNLCGDFFGDVLFEAILRKSMTINFIL